MAAAAEDLGQHLLVDADVVRRVVQAARLQAGESVLDAGAGTGALTLPCAAAVGTSGRVTAVEIDPHMAHVLEKAAPRNVDILIGDLLHVPLPDLDAVVANPPFKVAAPFIERIVTARIPRAVLVLPRELIERLAAKPGSDRYGKLTVRVALLAAVEDLGTLPRRAFEPKPDVPCGLLRLVAHTQPQEVDLVLLDEVLEAARAAWGRKARYAFGGLASRHRIDSASLADLLEGNGWADQRTAGLSPETFASITRHIAAAKTPRR